jgi:hypothetical protein
MPQWKVALPTTKTPRKRQHFQRGQGHSMTLAAASVISKIEYYTWEFKLYRVTHKRTRLKDK